MRKYSIEDPLYGSNITLLVGGTVKELNAWTKEYYDEDHQVALGVAGNASQFTCPKTGGKYFVIWVHEFDGLPNSHAILAHELLHLTFWLLNSIGIKHTEDSEEAFTYLFDCVLKQALAQLHRRKGKK